jgi:hypothetical protein
LSAARTTSATRLVVGSAEIEIGGFGASLGGVATGGGAAAGVEIVGDGAGGVEVVDVAGAVEIEAEVEGALVEDAPKAIIALLVSV